MITNVLFDSSSVSDNEDRRQFEVAADACRSSRGGRPIEKLNLRVSPPAYLRPRCILRFLLSRAYLRDNSLPGWCF